MSIFETFKKELADNAAPKEVVKKKKSTPKRYSDIDVKSLQEFSGRLSVLSANPDKKTEKEPEKEGIGLVSGQGRVGIGSGRVKVSGQGRVEPDTVSGQGRVKDGSVSVSGLVEKEHVEISLNEARLTDIQTSIYAWFISNGMTGFFNRDLISKDTGIAHSTIRKAVRKLEATKLIFVGKYDMGTRTSPYKISNEKSIGIGSVSVSGQIGIGSVSGRYSYNSSSSSFLNLKTTTAKFFEHPESEFWKEQGVTAEMFERNIQEHGFDPEALIMSAKHYAFEYSQPGKTPPEKGHLIFLIGGIKKFGLWNRPASYVSYEKRLCEQMRVFREIHEKEIAELEVEKNENAFVAWYKNYLETPDSEEVKAVMDQASSFDLDNLRKKPDKKEAWLRTIWNKSRNMN